LKADLRVDALGARAEDSGSNWDAIVGARGAVDLTEKWHLFGYLDIGAGDSDLTWQAMAGIGYTSWTSAVLLLVSNLYSEGFKQAIF